MDRHDRVEDWADSLLAQHRSAPEGTASIEDQPFADALRRNRERRATFARVEAVVWLIGVALACGFGYAFLSNF